MNKRLLKLFLALALTLVLCGTASAEDTFLNETNNETTVSSASSSLENNTTQNMEPLALPDPYNVRTGISYTTIQAAIDDPLTINGDTIIVESGTYLESVIVKKNLAIIADGLVTVNGFSIITAGSGSTIQGFTTGSISLSSAQDCVISGNTVNQIILYKSNGNTISQNILTESSASYGKIKLERSSYNTISNNIIQNNVYDAGIWVGDGSGLGYSENNHIIGNTISNCYTGIKLDIMSRGSTLKNNILENNYYNLEIASWYQLTDLATNDIDTSNTVNGKTVYYIVGQNGLVIDETWDPGFLALISSDFIQVRNISISNNGPGIMIVGTNNSVIENCTFTANINGIELTYSSNNIIASCNFSQNELGIYAIASESNEISNNTFTGSGIELVDNIGYNNLSGNIISDAGYGIKIIGGEEDLISENEINNAGNGIALEGSEGLTTIINNLISGDGNGIGIELFESRKITISNNTIANCWDGIYINNALDFSENIISGNIISDNYENGILVAESDAKIIGNIIFNNEGYGIQITDSPVSIGSNGDGTYSYEFFYVDVTQNDIYNNSLNGILLRNGLANITFNHITGNNGGLEVENINNYWDIVDFSAQPINAENNWWGTNEDPSTQVNIIQGTVNYDPWLVLSLTADPENVLIGESSTITADLTQNSNGEDTSMQGTLPDGLEVNFNTDLGVIDTSATTTDGKATVNYTAEETGVATVSAALDTEEVTTIIDVTSPNRPPELDLADQTIAEGDTLHLVLDGYDPDGDGLSYSISGQPPESSFDASTGTFTWTTRYDQAGSYTVTFTVSDGSLTSDQTITITVENTNQAPEIQTIGDKSVYEGQAIEFEVEATDPDGTPLTYSLDMLPPGASFDSATGIFTWTPNYQQSGPNLLTFTVTDGELSDSETIHLDVVNVNQAPVLNPVGDQTVSEGQMLEFTVDATDPDGQALSYTAGYSVQDLIQLGAVFNSETRTFTWTPNFDQADTYTIPFTVSDGELSDTQLANIIVENTNRMPTLMAIGNKAAYENQYLQFSVDALDADGDSLTYSTAGLPTGATFDVVTRIFSWTPTTGQSGTYKVTFTVSDGELSVSETININVYNTPSGSGVTVSPVDPVTGQSPVTISFSNVLSGGTTTVSTSATGPEPPAGFVTGDPPLYYEISTTASNQPPVTVAIHYEESMFNDESTLRLFHYENGAWVDITTSQDLVNNIIYGSVSSLSPFSVFERIANKAPTAMLDGPYAAYEGSEITFDGSASMDPDGDTLTYKWDLDGDGTFETPGMMVSKTWLDDYTGTVSLKVTDSQGLFSVASSTVTVTNTAPAATLSSSFFVKVPINMRVAGQPGNSVELQILQDGVVIASKTVVFTEGSPNEQEVSLLANIDLSKTYTGRLVFSTGGQTSGATPVWLIIDGKKTKVATFKSNPNNPASWSQTLNIPLKGLFTLANKEITFNAQASDSGADAITFEWSFGDGTPLVVNTYTSDGTTVINDSVAHTYLQPGTYQLILRVRDDEGAEVTYQMEVRVV